MYSFTSRVRYSEVDENRTLSITALLNYMQDCSLFQTESFGYGPKHVEEVGLRWMVSSWQIEIGRLPSFGDQIKVSTWAARFKGLFASRDFTVVDDAGELLVRANSQWFMFDDASGRPVRPPESELVPYADDVANDVPLEMPPIGRKIKVPEGGVEMDEVRVTPAYIDTNHHVNNAQYVSIALSLLPRDLQVHNLDVQYIAAAKLGDTFYPRIVRLDEEEDSEKGVENGAAGGYIVALNDSAGSPYAVIRVR